MTTETTPKERITYFLNLLKKTNARFTDHKSAYDHLEKMLQETELFHRAFSDRMCILPLKDFRYNEQTQIRSKETMNQMILLSTNGSYGIFQNPERNFMLNIEEYKNGNCPELVHIPNLYGKKLW